MVDFPRRFAGVEKSRLPLSAGKGKVRNTTSDKVLGMRLLATAEGEDSEDDDGSSEKFGTGYFARRRGT